MSLAAVAVLLVRSSSALALLAPARAPLALGRTAVRVFAPVRMALPTAVEEFVPENVASDVALMKQAARAGYTQCAHRLRAARCACAHWHHQQDACSWRGASAAARPVSTACVGARR